jgi:hypothetical protein
MPIMLSLVLVTMMRVVTTIITIMAIGSQHLR